MPRVESQNPAANCDTQSEPAGLLRYVVTLVHGTFSPQAAWTLPGSELREMLTASVPGQVLFHPFRWSGRNRVSERARAAGHLRDHLATLVKEHKDAVHVVVAHSHGGNVVLRALTEPGLRRDIDGVACLSTPFLSVTWKSFGAALLVHVGVGMGWAALWIANWAFERSGWSDIRLLFLAAMAVWLPLMVLGLAGQGRLEASAQALCANSQIQTKGLPSMLIVRSPADEASAGLAAAQLVTWATGWVARLVSAVTAVPLRRAGSGVESAVGSGILALWPVFVVATSFLGGLPDLRLLDVAFWIAVPSMIVCGCVLILTAFQAIAALFAFGPDAAMRGVLLELSPEPVPPGRWTVEQLPASDDPALRHARSYSDARALELLAAWVKGLGRRRGPGPRLSD